MTYWLDTAHIDSFQTDTTSGKVIDELFVNVWDLSALHRSLYEHCRMDICIYILIKKQFSVSLED